jgi:hypothetical protein
VKGFVVVDVKMQRRSAARRCDLGPHREAASGFFAAEMNLITSSPKARRGFFRYLS